MPFKLKTAEPVKDFRIEFTWAEGPWLEIFDEHVKLIRSDVERARAADRNIVYLSCPISSRGGGHFRTNVEIAEFTMRRLLAEWGERFFILNPASYQLESKQGTGLIMAHIEKLFPKVKDPAAYIEELKAKGAGQHVPGGGDYMRMWTRVLVEDGTLKDQNRKGLNCGGFFDGYYFLGPSDIRKFFAQSGGTSLTAAVEEFFARQYSIDPDFRSDFESITGAKGVRRLLITSDAADAEIWGRLRKEFFRFYTLRAGAAYSLGSHDEWNIFVRLNRRRVSLRAPNTYGPGEQLAGYFDGHQIDTAAAEQEVSPGYEITPSAPSAPPHPSETSWPS